MDEANGLLLYLDQNILQYDFENKVQISENPIIQWIYSDEHFNEIRRKENPRFFEVLRRVKARKLKIILDAKYQITDKATLLDYEDPEALYREYLETIGPFKFAERMFSPLQTFFFGNKDALEPEEYGNTFKSVLDQIMKDALTEIDVPQLAAQVKQESDAVIDELTVTLKSAKEQMQPLSQIRKILSSRQFSDLKEEDGCIIDQIWCHIGKKAHPITKDQMFGKEKFFHEIESDSDIYHPLYLAVIRCHSALNIFGYWPDEGLPKQSKLDGINSDASHIAHSFFCSGIVSSDIRMCKKASAIYRYFNVPQTVYRVEI